MGKKKIHLRFLRINQILSSHNPRNIKRFSMKPNIRIITFIGIQIARNHILKNQDARSNVDYSISNATLMAHLFNIKFMIKFNLVS